MHRPARSRLAAGVIAALAVVALAGCATAAPSASGEPESSSAHEGDTRAVSYTHLTLPTTPYV